jgi:glutathione S-transferase
VFLDWFDRVWKEPPNAIEAELGRSEPDQARIEALGRRMIESLDLFEEMLSGRDHLFGDELSAADIAAFPFLKYAVLHESGDDELFHLILRDRQRDDRRRPRLAGWIERMNALPRA